MWPRPGSTPNALQRTGSTGDAVFSGYDPGKIICYSGQSLGISFYREFQCCVFRQMSGQLAFAGKEVQLIIVQWCQENYHRCPSSSLDYLIATVFTGRVRFPLDVTWSLGSSAIFLLTWISSTYVSRCNRLSQSY
jgi:hypothetical protein